MKLDEKVKREELSDVQHLLSSQNGRRFLWRVLSHCGVYQDIRTDDPREDSRALGRRSVGLWVMQVLGDADPEQLFNMMREAEARTKEHQLMAEREVATLDGTKKPNVDLGVDSFLS